MSDAPTMPDFSKTVNAALIGCADLLERPALIVNKIKAFVMLKINANTSCNPKRLGYSLDMKTNNELRNKIACYSFNGKVAEVVIGIYSKTVFKTFPSREEAEKFVAEYNCNLKP